MFCERWIMHPLRSGVLLLLTLLLSACATTVGGMETRTIDTGGVRRIELKGIGDLEVLQGDHEELVIEADAATMDRILVDVRGDTLIIRLRSGFWLGAIMPSQEIRYRLTVRELASIALEGAGDVQVKGLEADSLTLALDGAGSLTADDLTAEALTVRHRGAGNVTMRGQAALQEVTLTGAGNYSAADLVSQIALVQIEGAGEATVWAQQRLDARVSGVGSIRYYGEPLLDQRIDGLGQVKSLGAR